MDKGNIRRFFLTTAAAANMTWLTGEQSNSYSRSTETIDVTDKDGEWAKFMAGRRSATADVTVFLDDTADAAQHKLLKALHAGDTVYCFIGTLGTGTNPSPVTGDLFEAVITAANDTNDKDAVAQRQFTLQVTGEPTHYPDFD